MAAQPLPYTPTEGQHQQHNYQQQLLQQQQQQQQQQQRQPQSQSPSQQQQQQQHMNSHTPLSPPQSPSVGSVGGSGGGSPREQARITLLFEINVILLQEVQRLQALGQGGATNPQQVAQLKAAGQPEKMASEEYIQCLRRVQANLTYLMPKAQQKDANSENPAAAAAAAAAKQSYAGPLHMTAPPAAEKLDVLREKYERLRGLFPGWQGIDQRAGSGSNASPSPGGGGGGTGM